MLKNLLLLLLCSVLLPSCAGYKLGNQKPTELSSVSSIDVPLFENKTQEQRLATLVTNSMVDAITRDGTYQITTNSASDATLVGVIERISYSERRADRFDTLRASELNVRVHVKWELINSQNQVLASGKDVGRSYFSTEANQQLSRNNSFPDAAMDVSEHIIQRLANGF